MLLIQAASDLIMPAPRTGKRRHRTRHYVFSMRDALS
jgi:hypothetical protein